MSNNHPIDASFFVGEDDSGNVTIEISEEDFERDLATGIDEDSMPRPYKMIFI